MYLITARNMDGSEDVLPPYAWLLYVRGKNWAGTPVGSSQQGASLSISSGSAVLNFTSKAYARAWLYILS